MTTAATEDGPGRGRSWLRGCARVAMLGLAAGTVMLGLGFAWFLGALPSIERDPDEPVDALVALTGGSERVEEALGLLARGFGTRLLITGVNERTSREGIRRFNAGQRHLLECCVDLDYRARDTVGNAEAISRWAREHRFRSVLVVTSNYHLPRALAELDHAAPEIRKVPYAVVPSPRAHDGWAVSVARMRLLGSEYVKFLTVWTRNRLPLVRTAPVPSSPGLVTKASATG